MLFLSIFQNHFLQEFLKISISYRSRKIISKIIPNKKKCLSYYPHFKMYYKTIIIKAVGIRIFTDLLTMKLSRKLKHKPTKLLMQYFYKEAKNAY